MIKNVIVDRNTNVKAVFDKFTPIDLSYYAENNIPNYDTITEIPKKNMDYINSVKYASDCDSMFVNCSNLTTIDLSKFDTSYVTNMRGMFLSCHSLSSLVVSNFDTSSVTNMDFMFDICELLTSLDLSNFDTSNVISMRAMFEMCSKLTTLDLSNFDTSKVTDMVGMFLYCTNLNTIKGTLDCSSRPNIENMFDNTPNLRNVHLKNVPRSLLSTDGSLQYTGGTLNETYIIDNILEDK